MYYLSDDLEKIKIIDRAFNALSLDEVKSLFGADIIVDKLKGTSDRDGPLAQAAKELHTAANDIGMLRADCISLRSDIQVLIKCLNRGLGDQSVLVEFNQLKSKHCIY